MERLDVSILRRRCIFYSFFLYSFFSRVIFWTFYFHGYIVRSFLRRSVSFFYSNLEYCQFFLQFFFGPTKFSRGCFSLLPPKIRIFIRPSSTTLSLIVIHVGGRIANGILTLENCKSPRITPASPPQRIRSVTITAQGCKNTRPCSFGKSIAFYFPSVRFFCWNSKFTTISLFTTKFNYKLSADLQSAFRDEEFIKFILHMREYTVYYLNCKYES